MKMSKVRFVAVAFLLLFSVFTVSVLISSPRSTANLVVKENRAPRQSHPTLPENLYAQAAEALRQGDLQTARQNLDEVAARHPREAAQTRVVAGLYAHEAGEKETAGEILASASVPGSPLEDWRLYLLAQDAARRGEHELARTTYARLIADSPDSPLRPLAWLESVELAMEQGQPRLALALAAEARRAGIEGEQAEELESLAWEISRKLEDEQAQREAGRRLLVVDPLSSEAVQVVRTFRTLDGELDWNRLLSSAEILRRAESFLDGGSPQAAISTLKEIPEGERGFDWHLLQARALTKGGDGWQALAVLDTVIPATAGQQTALEWQRVLATAEMGDPGAATGYLAKLAQSLSPSEGALEIPRDSLRRLYKDFQEAGLFEPALATLRLLRRVDPADETGAADLWERGWKQYQGGNPAGAVGYWTELAELYPDDGDAQRGRYWKARALEEMGQPERAREMYRDLVAASDTSDFYGRQAMTRLGEIPPVEGEGLALAKAPAAGAWPEDPALRRAKMLTDLGLDELASREIELASGTRRAADRRDVLALKGLILCRKGEQRTGLILLRDAFPALAGPYQSSVPVEILFAYYPLHFGDEIRTYARETGLPGYLIAGIIRQESAFDPRATSPVGARGLMQLMPGTAQDVSRKVGVPYQPEELYDPELSVRLGATYFKQLLDRFDGNVELALAGYNGGPNRIHRLWKESGRPDVELADFVETLHLDESRNYVKRILVLADSYRQLYPSLG